MKSTMSDHRMDRRTFLASAAGAGLVVTIGPSAHALQFPSRPMTIMLPFPAGTNADVVGRFVAEGLNKKFGVPVVVESKPMAATVPATSSVLAAPADGHVLFESGTATNINPLLGVKAPYDPQRDLTPVVLLGITPGVLCVHPSVKANNLKEFIEEAKTAPKPLMYSSPAYGSFPHLAMEQLKQKAGINLEHVSFRGFGPAMIGLLRNDVQVSVTAIPSALPNMKEGKVKALAQMGTERMPQLPNLPTVAEAGVPGYEAAGFLGVWVKTGTPLDVVATLNKEINAVLTSDEIKKYAHNEGIKIAGGTADTFKAHLKHDREVWGPVIKAGNIKVDQ